MNSRYPTNSQPNGEAHVRVNVLLNEAWELRFSDYKRSINLAEQALELAQQADAVRDVARSLNLIGWGCNRLGLYSQAVKPAQEALRIAAQHQFPVEEGYALVNLSVCYGAAGDMQAALAAAQRVIEIGEQQQHFELTAMGWHDLGGTYLDFGDFEQARLFLEKSVDVARQHKTPLSTLAYANLAVLFIRQKEYEAADAYLQQAVEHASETSFLFGVMFALEVSCASCIEQGKLDYAERYLAEWEQLVEASGSGTIELRMAKAKLLYKQGKADEALAVAGQAAQMIEAEALFGYDEMIHKLLSEIHEQRGAYREALEHDRLADAAHQTIYDDQTARRLDILRTLHEVALLNAEKEALQRSLVERKKREDAEAELHLRSTALETTASAVIITDRNGVIQWANPAFTMLTGYTLDEALGKNPRELIRSGVHEQDFFAGMWNALLAGQVWRGELVNRRKDGTLYHEEQTITPVRDDSGNITHFIAIKIDVTARKEAEQQSFELALERERIRIVTNFVKDAAHEFRTPLAVMESSLYLMNRADTPEMRRLKSTQIQQQIRLMAGLVDQLLKIIYLDGGAAFVWQTLNVNDFVEMLAPVWDQRVTQAGHALVVDLVDFPLLIRADAHYFEDALWQIINNAMQFTPPNGIITIRTALHEGCVVVEIHNTGSYISPEALPHIFERFYREDSSHSTAGFGLGLSIVQKIVQEHHGEVEVLSDIDEGTMIRLMFPAFAAS